jgi:Protein of unknown function DUF262/Protein of unknown function (DUF1524)
MCAMFRGGTKKQKPPPAVLGSVTIDWAGADDAVPPGITSQMLTLRGLLRSASVFIVPPYQRAYAWGEDQVSRLLDDTLQACAEDKAYYFLGTSVRQCDENGAHRVIDGQQRLMTLTLILAYLRDNSGDKATAERLQELIAPKGKTFARLLVRRADQTLVRDFVQTSGKLDQLVKHKGSPAQRRLAQAAEAVIETLKPLSGEALVNYAHFLCRKLTFNVIDADSDVSAATLFNVLNQRGLKLPESTLVKSQLLVRASLSAAEADELSERWDQREVELGEETFEALLKLTPLILTADPKRKNSALSLFYEREFTPQQCADFVREQIWKYLDLYYQFTPAQIELCEAGPEAKRLLKCLLLYREKLWMAPAIDFLATHAVDAPETLEFLHGLERLCFLRAMGVIPDRNLHSRFARVTQARGKPAALQAAGALGLNPSEPGKLIGKLNEACNEHTRRILALRANAMLPGGEVILENHTEVTVEHIKPRADNDYWRKKFPDKDDREDITDLLGNYTLVHPLQNHDADDKPYEFKRKIYFETKYPIYALTRDLENVRDWNLTAAKRRHEKLVNLLCKDLGIAP